jgi:hypothetical protein
MPLRNSINAEITRFVDASQPGFVELVFTDAVGRTHRFVEKVPVVTVDHLNETSTYPQPAAIDCVVISRGLNDAGEAIVTVDTSRPWDIASTTGDSTFVVRPKQLEIGRPQNEPSARFVVFVDVDDTLVRSVGSKRIPVPHVAQHVVDLAKEGATMYLWSRGGAEYALATAMELGVADCFAAFLSKPNILLDDESFASWRGVVEIHPSSCRGLGIEDYKRRVAGA